MPDCELCKQFVARRKQILQDITKLPYTEDEKKMIYYDDRMTDQELEKGSMICQECLDTVCSMVSQETKISCEEIKHFLTVQLPKERENRQKRKKEIGKRFEKIQLNLIENEPSCKKCKVYGEQRSSLRKLSEQQVNDENEQCGKCLTLCQQKQQNNEYCRRTRAQKEVSDRDKERYRLENLTKLTNVQIIQQKLKTK